MNTLECIVTDLDDSLLGPDKRISPRDLATIRALKAKGVHFFIVTGRHPDFVKQFAHDTGYDLPIAACNGAQVYDYASKTNLMHLPIAHSLAKEIFNFLNEKKRHYIIYTPTSPYFTPENPRISFWQQVSGQFELENRFDIRYIDDHFHFDDHIIIKFLLPHAVEEERQELERLFNNNGELSMVFSGKGLLDVNAAGATKGNAVRYLATQYGFSLENTLALGDNFNDTSMLEVCGYPVVPANGEEDVRKIARFVTSHHSQDPLTTAVQALFPALFAELA